MHGGRRFDGMPYGEVVRSGMSKPFLFLFANRRMFDTAESDLKPDAAAFLAAIAGMRSRIPAHPSLLLLDGAAHFNFFDQALLSEPTLWRLFGALGPIDQPRALEVTRRYLRAFFDRHLKATSDGLLDGRSADFPEMVFR